MPKIARPILARIRERIIFENGCWGWKGVKDPSGYPRLWIGSRTDGSRACGQVARLVFELCCHSIPKGMSVLHHCDNPECVRPDHLWLGTQLDNIKDRDQKRRHWAHRGLKQTWYKRKKRE